MATEILNLEVKSNVKGAVKGVDDLTTSVDRAAEAEMTLTENIKFQNEIINEQEMALLNLKKQQTVNSEWDNHIQKMPERIASATLELKGEKIALKKLNNERKAAAQGIGKLTKEQKASNVRLVRGVQHFQIMGVSIRRLRNTIRGIVPAFRLLFGTIKSGIAATGIGVLVLAFISLVTWFKKSAKGSKLLSAAFEGIGVVVSAITDTIVAVGDAIASVFGMTDSAPHIRGVDRIKKAYKDLKKTMDEVELRVSAQQLQHRLNEKLIEDTTRAENKRLKAAKENYKLDKDNLADIIRDQRAVVQAIKEKGEGQEKNILRADKEHKQNIEKRKEMGMLIGSEKELSSEQDIAAQLRKKTQEEENAEQIKLNDLLFKSKVLAIKYHEDVIEIKSTNIEKTEELAEKEKKAAEKANKLGAKRIQQFVKSIKETMKAEEVRDKALVKFANSQKDAIEQEKIAVKDKWKFFINEEEKGSAKRIELEEAMQSELAGVDKKWQTKRVDTEVAAFSQLAGALSSLAGDNKELAAAGAIIDTYAGANKAFAQGGVAGFVTGAAIIAAGLANVKKIYSTDAGDGGGGGAIAAEPPAPEMMSGAFTLGGGQAVEPLQAYVVSDDITNNQNKLAIIRRRATI